MRSGRLAQRILSLVVPDERAGAIAGDLIESSVRWRPVRFWISLARIVTALVLRDMRESPLRFAAFAPISWFGYMFVALMLIACGIAACEAGWGVAYFLTNHTGVELLTDWLHIQIDGPTPQLFMEGVEVVMVAIMAPFVTGRLTARWWPRRELAAAVVMVLSWPLLAATMPLVGARAAATIGVVPVMVVCVFFGTLWARLRQPAQPV